MLTLKKKAYLNFKWAKNYIVNIKVLTRLSPIVSFLFQDILSIAVYVDKVHESERC